MKGQLGPGTIAVIFLFLVSFVIYAATGDQPVAVKLISCLGDYTAGSCEGFQFSSLGIPGAPANDSGLKTMLFSLASIILIGGVITVVSGKFPDPYLYFLIFAIAFGSFAALPSQLFSGSGAFPMPETIRTFLIVGTVSIILLSAVSWLKGGSTF